MRVDGYAPIRDYAVIGDGRSLALVARDGSIDWSCLPDLDSGSVFGALLDCERGGCFRLAPKSSFEARRRYLPDTNVLETTFTTATGAVRVTDAMLLPGRGLAPARELVRRIQGLSGEVAMSWRVVPRFQYGRAATRMEQRMGVPVASAGSDAVAVQSWDAGGPDCDRESTGGEFVAGPGTDALVSLAVAHQEPLVLSPREGVESRLDGTVAFWRRWAAQRAYDGPWREAVIRSALALKLLVYAQSGAIAAAGTTSLPESIGGERNWDYRFCWIRDSSFTLDALNRLGCVPETHSFFSWLLHASQRTHPELQVLYRLNGDTHAPERTLPWRGYLDSRPVRIGNEAAGQRQLDIFGHLLQTAWLYARAGNSLDRETGRRLTETADLVCELWRERDSGIWEVRSQPQHFTQSKLMCWVALDRALRLVDARQLPGNNAQRWLRERDAIRDFIESRCWSDRRRSYVRFAGAEEVDASVLFAVLMGYGEARDTRLRDTVDAIRRELGRGPLLYRYTGDDGLAGDEGCFVACSYWLVEALARTGRTDAAAETMQELLGLANDVGLYAEEIEPETGDFLGNVPQGLVHLALISAATALAEESA